MVFKRREAPVEGVFIGCPGKCAYGFTQHHARMVEDFLELGGRFGALMRDESGRTGCKERARHRLHDRQRVWSFWPLDRTPWL